MRKINIILQYLHKLKRILQAIKQTFNKYSNNYFIIITSLRMFVLYLTKQLLSV